MLGRTYDGQNCSVARALEVVGERWSLLIIRNAVFAGSTRFTQFQRQLRVAPNILSNRLARFVEAGLMRTRPVAGDSDLHEYVLTPQGLDLQPVIVALAEWGDRWAAPQGPPVIFVHDDCGGTVHSYLNCERCHAEPNPPEVTTRPGPGANKASGKPARR
ncbi:winged helix-turn-helix transcriptional regulator [Kibdelosporangium phytohabitans]|uniref:HTH hxlR-type domain-containing protein n=1 Tax=Kibdelosporangium phytohabitans TaxID=860235 RepID=A0A0N9IAQ3_9PSEU|nr:helix-turn-helix domain-containing protein [Kibdelosporangium phytohabitans]ALG12179.1 hypothetical protein AOZ06_39735 [Kibdelosporangium phytohabitans]MBE1463707.1 DNA-binding HxlR family transcriptional regulator [Kibdelosporangium phytohabitans]